MTRLIFFTKHGPATSSKDGKFANVLTTDDWSVEVVTADGELATAPYVRVGNKSFPLVRCEDVEEKRRFELPKPLIGRTKRRVGSLEFFSDSRMSIALFPKLLVTSNHFENDFILTLFEKLYELVADPQSLIRASVRKRVFSREEEVELLSGLLEVSFILREIEDLVFEESRPVESFVNLALGKVRSSDLTRQGLSSYLVSRNDERRFVSGPIRSQEKRDPWEVVVPLRNDLRKVREDLQRIVSDHSANTIFIESKLDINALANVSSSGLLKKEALGKLLDDVTTSLDRIWRELDRVDHELLLLGKENEVPDKVVDVRERIRSLFRLDSVRIHNESKDWFSLGSDTFFSDCLHESGFDDDTKVFEKWFVALVVRNLLESGVLPVGTVPSLRDFFAGKGSAPAPKTQWLVLTDRIETVALAYEPPMRSHIKGGVSVGGECVENDKTPDLVIGSLSGPDSDQFKKLAVFDAKYVEKIERYYDKMSEYGVLAQTNFVCAVKPDRQSSIKRLPNGLWQICLSQSDDECNLVLRSFISRIFLESYNVCMFCGQRRRGSECHGCLARWYDEHCGRAGGHGYQILRSDSEFRSALVRSVSLVGASSCTFCAPSVRPLFAGNGLYRRE